MFKWFTEMAQDPSGANIKEPDEPKEEETITERSLLD